VRKLLVNNLHTTVEDFLEELIFEEVPKGINEVFV
jgi:hypothetical protein